MVLAKCRSKYLCSKLSPRTGHLNVGNAGPLGATCSTSSPLPCCSGQPTLGANARLVVLAFLYSRFLHTASTKAAKIYIPTNTKHILTITNYRFERSHSNYCKGTRRCGLYYISLVISDIEVFFFLSVAHLYVFL